ncbi:CAAX prenyl protease 2 [Spathaspora sp. JA1]|nr:CAAX prenyl protease 2 [Spathaspora sp. JA1]
MLILSLAIAFSYFIVIYVNPPEYLPSNRNDLRVIKFRFTRIIQLCLTLLITIPYIVPGNYIENIRSLGLFPGFTHTHDLSLDLINIGRAVLLVVTLYCSSIYQYYLQDITFIDENAQLLHHIRDYLFAPITEEFIYRGIINLVVSDTRYTPCLFGIAHLHHAWHLYKQGHALDQVVLSSIFQLIYTSIFGYIANLVYLISGYNLLCVIVIHAGCNLFGIPQLTINGSKLQKLIYYLLLVGGGVGVYIEITWWV